ncbi:MAG TPA: DUF1684 domain-containing protein [Ignavibacteriales bacterium]|nr:DUF1684 domain-containing protein [Ignavibacteriales bacterium]
MKIFIQTLLLSLLLVSCSRDYTPEEKSYIEAIKKDRADKDIYMRDDALSPFNGDRGVPFEPLKYYDVDPNFVFKSKLTEYSSKDTIAIYGTKGEERKAVKYGYLTFAKDDKKYKVNLYKGFAKSGEEYFSIWFTDKTTNEETYGVGRYLDFELSQDPGYIYTLDFNMAYNPYCAYNARYSCAIPTKEDHLDLAIEAGEKKFHH